MACYVAIPVGLHCAAACGPARIDPGSNGMGRAGGQRRSRPIIWRAHSTTVLRRRPFTVPQCFAATKRLHRHARAIVIGQSRCYISDIPAWRFLCAKPPIEGDEPRRRSAGRRSAVPERPAAPGQQGRRRPGAVPAHPQRNRTTKRHRAFVVYCARPQWAMAMTSPADAFEESGLASPRLTWSLQSR